VDGGEVKKVRLESYKCKLGFGIYGGIWYRVAGVLRGQSFSYERLDLFFSFFACANGRLNAPFSPRFFTCFAHHSPASSYSFSLVPTLLCAEYLFCLSIVDAIYTSFPLYSFSIIHIPLSIPSFFSISPSVLLHPPPVPSGNITLFPSFYSPCFHFSRLCLSSSFLSLFSRSRFSFPILPSHPFQLHYVN